MSYQRVKCKRGHSFMTSVYSRYQTIRCPQCETDNRMASSSSGSSYAPVDTSFSWSSSDSGSSPSSSDSFSSGGGGDFGGGGAGGDY
jgi:uncharacterized membrane protein YgcG